MGMSGGEWGWVHCLIMLIKNKQKMQDQGRFILDGLTYLNVSFI